LNKFEFENWLIENGRSDRTARHYSIALCGKLSDLANETGIFSGNILSIAQKEEFAPVAEALMGLVDFEEFNRRGNQMYSAALNRYADFLENVDLSFYRDIETIQDDETLAKTTRKALIESRVGQGKFRAALKQLWGACSVTDFSNSDLLIASHIKPWRVSTNFERLDKYNGLLLQPNLDALFDKGYISLDHQGLIMLSKTFQASALALGAKSTMKLRSIDELHRPYFEYHREKLFFE
jgi:hypothetical protein